MAASGSLAPLYGINFATVRIRNGSAQMNGATVPESIWLVTDWNLASRRESPTSVISPSAPLYKFDRQNPTTVTAASIEGSTNSKLDVEAKSLSPPSVASLEAPVAQLLIFDGSTFYEATVRKSNYSRSEFRENERIQGALRKVFATSEIPPSGPTGSSSVGQQQHIPQQQQTASSAALMSKGRPTLKESMAQRLRREQQRLAATPEGSNDPSATAVDTATSIAPSEPGLVLRWVSKDASSAALPPLIESTTGNLHWELEMWLRIEDFAADGSGSDARERLAARDPLGPTRNKLTAILKHVEMVPLECSAGINRCFTYGKKLQRITQKTTHQIQESVAATARLARAVDLAAKSALQNWNEERKNLLKGAARLLNEKKRKLRSVETNLAMANAELRRQAGARDGDNTEACVVEQSIGDEASPGEAASVSGLAPRAAAARSRVQGKQLTKNAGLRTKRQRVPPQLPRVLQRAPPVGNLFSYKNVVEPVGGPEDDSRSNATRICSGTSKEPRFVIKCDASEQGDCGDDSDSSPSSAASPTSKPLGIPGVVDDDDDDDGEYSNRAESEAPRSRRQKRTVQPQRGTSATEETGASDTVWRNFDPWDSGDSN